MNTPKDKISTMGIMSTDKVGTVRSNKIEFNYKGETTPGYDLHFKDDTPIIPSTILFNDANRNMLFLSPLKKQTLTRVDTETGKTLDDYRLKFDDVDINFTDITPSKKFSNFDSSDNVVSVVGLSNNYVFNLAWDTRMKENKEIDAEQRHNISSSTSIRTTRNGDIIVGDSKGCLRLFDNPETKGFKRSKTNLNQLADPVIGVDTSADGEWVIWTTKEYIAVVNTLFKKKGEFVSGFKTPMGTEKPDALILRIGEEDMKHFGIEEVSFKPARFDNVPYLNRDDKGVIEEYIVTSTGRFVVRWSLRHVVKRYKERDSKENLRPRIYPQEGNVVETSFQYQDKHIITALENNINTL